MSGSINVLATVPFFYGSSTGQRERGSSCKFVCRVFSDEIPRNGLLGQEVRMRGQNGNDQEGTSGMKEIRK